MICDPDKLDESGCQGAPDWIIEVVSPGSQQMDYAKKLFQYQTAGVREYWIVDPENETILVYDFRDETAEHYTFHDSVASRTLDGLSICIAELGGNFGQS